MKNFIIIFIGLLIEILDNTFFGTLLAGIILAYIGFSLYRKQKNIDIRYQDLNKIRESASLLFVNIEIATKYYTGMLNMHNNKDQYLNNVFNALNQKFNNHFQNEFDKQFNALSSKITLLSDNLIALLKIDNTNQKHNEIIAGLTEKLPMLSMYLLGGATVLNKSSAEDIENFEKGFFEASKKIKDTLEIIIKQNL